MANSTKEIQKQLSELTEEHITLIKDNFELIHGLYRTPVFKYCEMKQKDQNSIDKLLVFNALISKHKQWGLVGTKKLYNHIKNCHVTVSCLPNCHVTKSI